MSNREPPPSRPPATGNPGEKRRSELQKRLRANLIRRKKPGGPPKSS